MNKALNMLGLCARAGKMVSGEQSCDQAIKKGTAKLIVIDGGASERTKKSVLDACAYYHVAHVEVGEGELGYTIGKPGRMTAAIVDGNFADRIIELSNGEGQK